MTFPLVSLLMPLVLITVWRLENHDTFENVLFSIKSSLQWVVGYALTWFTKWILATVILGENVLKDAIDQVLLRSGNDIGEQISRIDTVKKVSGTYFMVIPKLTYFCVMVFGVILLFFSIRYYKRVLAVFKKTVVFFVIGCIPFIWVFVLANHSYLHYGFVYRIFMGTAFACGCFGTEYVRYLRKTS